MDKQVLPAGEALLDLSWCGLHCSGMIYAHTAFFKGKVTANSYEAILSDSSMTKATFTFIYQKFFPKLHGAWGQRTE